MKSVSNASTLNTLKTMSHGQRGVCDGLQPSYLPFGSLKHHPTDEMSLAARPCTPATWIRHALHCTGLFVCLFIKLAS